MIKANKARIVVSAINIFEGGPLSILEDCLSNLIKYYSGDYEIIALVHRKNLLSTSGIIFYEFPKSRQSYFFRLYYEYFYFIKFSKKLDPYLWISLHDISPNIHANRKVVYCHNPSIFFKASFRDFYFAPVIYFFSLFYKFLYEINIKRNDYVIVQQNWIKQEFQRIYRIQNVLTAYPSIPKPLLIQNGLASNDLYVFFFPSIPRSFKNFEIICEAIKILRTEISSKFKVILTIDGTENRYSKYIYKKYSKFKEIDFVGRKTREEVFELYNLANCLIFPSKLETWGLPLSEFKAFGKPIIVSDLPYAHETIGEYDNVCFFDPNDPKILASIMMNAINGDNSFFLPHHIKKFVDAENWKELLNIIIN